MRVSLTNIRCKYQNKTTRSHFQGTVSHSFHSPSSEPGFGPSALTESGLLETYKLSGSTSVSFSIFSFIILSNVSPISGFHVCLSLCMIRRTRAALRLSFTHSAERWWDTNVGKKGGSRDLTCEIYDLLEHLLERHLSERISNC